MNTADLEGIFEPIFMDFPAPIRRDDLAKAVEAQGHLIVAILQRLIAGKLSDEDMPLFRAVLTELRFILMTQADPTRDEDNSAVYSDGTEAVSLRSAEDRESATSMQRFSAVMNHDYYLGESVEQFALESGVQIVIASPPEEGPASSEPR